MTHFEKVYVPTNIVTLKLLV